MGRSYRDIVYDIIHVTDSFGNMTVPRLENRNIRYQDRYRIQMTRSAPPSRTTPKPQHNQSSTSRALKPRAKSAAAHDYCLSISLGDIYQSAEKERLNYSSACRRQNLEHAQSQTQFFRSDTVSRSVTSMSRHTDNLRQDVPTPISAWSEPVQSRPNSILPNTELQDLLEDDDEEEDLINPALDMFHHTSLAVNVSPISKDCCEIIGPQMCYECRKNRIRQIHKERSEMMFPTLEPSEDNLTTASIVKKYLPGLSYPEIEIKIARGEIARPGFRIQHNKTVEFSDEEEEAKPKITNKKVTIVDKKTTSVSRFKTNELFFTNIRDLNNKIVTGSVDRNSGFVKSRSSLNLVKKEVAPSKSHYPNFVSPRKVQLVTETKYKTYFEPPLIEKSKQDVEPAFFAGSTGEYQLPEKLPDELVFVDKYGNEVKASDSEGFIAKVSATREAGNKRNQEKSNIPTEKTGASKDLTILKEDDEEEEESDSTIFSKTEIDGQQWVNKCTQYKEKSTKTIELSTENSKQPIQTVKARTVNRMS